MKKLMINNQNGNYLFAPYDTILRYLLIIRLMSNSKIVLFEMTQD